MIAVRRMHRAALVLLSALVAAPGGAALSAADWPQWRYDAGRGAASPEPLPAELHLHWVRRLPPPRPAWPASQPGLRFDESYAPVAAGGRLFVPSTDNDSLTAYELASGAEQWRFYTGGPVRLPPAAHAGRVYFGSDDGHLYCVDAAGGRLLWRVRGGPSDRRVLGNERLISTWPVRGGPVILDAKAGATVFFTAGIWPFMGIFAHAVDAGTGRSLWVQSGDGSAWTTQPHNSPAFGGFVPRGPLAATPLGLAAPGGRTPPACYDLETGKLSWPGFGLKNSGTWLVTARGPYFFAGGLGYRLSDGKLALAAAPAVHDETALYAATPRELFAQSLEIQAPSAPRVDRKGKPAEAPPPGLKELWSVPLPENIGRLFIKAGPRFYFGAEGQLSAVEARPEEKKATVVWQAPIEGVPWSMAAADRRLIVTTKAGMMYCFGPGPAQAKTLVEPASPAGGPSAPPAAADPLLEAVLRETGASEGCAVVFGAGADAAGWIDGLIRRTRMEQIVADPDASAVDALRRRADRQGVYGRRLSAHVGDPADFALPPYLASLVVAGRFPPPESELRDVWLRRTFQALRPYGGAACLPLDAAGLESLVRKSQLEGARVKPLDAGHALLVRDGPLPGAADWTHQYADAANTVVSQDRRVRAPLGLLWFGGPSNDEVLPRHGHGPNPQVAAGRIVVEGRHMLRALDAYTGRLLWQRDLPDLGRYYDNTSHQPGAGEIGGNYVTLPDAVYVAWQEKLLQLDAASGRTVRESVLGPDQGGKAGVWGFLAVWEDLLIATSSPVAVKMPSLKDKVVPVPAPPAPPSLADSLLAARYASASRRLAVHDRREGKLLWQREARYGFRHNTIVAGAGKVFAIDGLSPMQQDVLRRRGVDLGRFAPRLLALDARTGKELWATGENVTATFLNYSAEHDVLLAAGSAGRDRAMDESGTGMAAYRGCDGRVLWQDPRRKHGGPCMIRGQTILTQGAAFELLSGKPIMRKHPLTGEPLPWQFSRNYGCGAAVAGQDLIAFRSAAAGYFDLARDGGTGNLGGFKSGCTSNLIPAGGLLCAPEFTRTCTCTYQNQTSLALVHDPEAEMWTFNALPWDGKPVRRVGLNFGAPGDRRADDGTLWLDWPSAGSPSPELPVEVQPKPATTYRHHASRVRAGGGAEAGQGPPPPPGLPWVAASGLRGARRVTVALAAQGGPPRAPRKYTVRLHYAEADGAAPGERAFSVRVQGREAFARVDIAAEAGPWTALVKEVRGVEASDKLTVELAPAEGAARPETLLGGIEVVAEGW